MIRPKFLWDNVLRGITPTFSGTTVSGKFPIQSLDWKDFTIFEADSGNLDFTMTADTDIDSWSVYVANFTGTGDQKVELFYESSPATFTSLGDVDPVGGKLTFNEFTEVTVLSGRKIRLTFTVGTGSLLVRQIVVGKVLESEQGQYVTATNPTYGQGVIENNMFAQNGSILGRTIKRLERRGSLDIEYVTEDWFRNTWQSFFNHAARYAFIYINNPRDYPDDVAFTVAMKQDTYRNSGKGDRKNIKWQIRSLVADELAV